MYRAPYSPKVSKGPIASTVIPAKAGIHFFILLAFLVNMFGPLPSAQAQEFRLPAPGQMVALSPAFSPAVLKGIKLDPQNPFRFHFFVDRGDSPLSQEELKRESAKLIKYFLASLTIPEKDLWVNLSPYEKDHIVPQEFGQTEMGRDLLAEDYLLKQITASLIYPESQLGKTSGKKSTLKLKPNMGQRISRSIHSTKFGSSQRRPLSTKTEAQPLYWRII